ncbi:MAG: site-2 protease family protein [Nitrosopumilaceae archaeon]|uniref:Site-2 protease family protein n=3 Tax=Candidatus Nitrosomaritimum aestuariumsis TaxID=3342354 RepID=A0AC60W762_9ARCH|nr:site-2 protease family protein [Nitrosopumilaceae archaeon]MBA4454703.1 site-2 protease family protein [Nitrosopumilaceae archaeon]MBA4459449.1 site-2 protease family protein [Nitrosopumilaceae archaeon]MBA4461745.1 site-2 protease family protein [Nitrosopumilaceae archaeon]MBA4463080.1 site-2 protease family protein [Nitrosopumilaceae archaeon]
MSDPNTEEVISLVNSMFSVSNFTREQYSLEFKIDDLDFKTKFEELARKLNDINYVGKIERMNNENYIIIQKFPPRKKRRILSSSWTPRILFVVVIAFVWIDGYFRTIGTNTISEIGNPEEMAIIYTLSLLGILGIHELGHMIAARIHRLKTTWPYFIPGIPVGGFLPTFGALIIPKAPMINRKILFDVAIAGPIAGLIIAIIVALFGAYTAPIIELDLAQELYEENNLQKFTFGEPLFLKGALELFGKGGPDTEILLTPVLWAAWIGFFITFLNLMPAWQLDGGHMARTILGAKLHSYCTYGSLILLTIIGYEFAAIMIYFLSRRGLSATPLDDITPVSKNRKIAYLGIIGLAILCMPIPENICMPFTRSSCLF